MKTFKLLTLTAIGVGLLSGLSFAQDFPVTVTATVTAPAPQYTLQISGMEKDSINFDLTSIRKGYAIKKDQSIKIFQGNINVTQSVKMSIKNIDLSNNIASARLSVDAGAGDYAIVSLNFKGLSAGEFKQTTALSVTAK